VHFSSGAQLERALNRCTMFSPWNTVYQTACVVVTLSSTPNTPISQNMVAGVHVEVMEEDRERFKGVMKQAESSRKMKN